MKKIISVLMLLGTFTFAIAQSTYYKDYQRSVNDVNWQTVVADLLLTNQQKNELFALNNKYTNYDDWNRVYSKNPDRWSSDRYTAIERILGSEKYSKFKTQYYKGKNPVAVYNSNKNNLKPYTNNGKEKSKKAQNHNKKDNSRKSGKAHK